MTDDFIRLEYNQNFHPLEKLLTGVERTGDFFTNGAVEIPMPKIEIEGVGVLSFPVPAAQVAALIQHAVRAPYGRGAETILDESVRRVWQLPPDKVRIGGKSWAASFEGILQQVIAGLGCSGLRVSAELYKLLVYDPGGFFLAHRDTEKADGMFGTLVVVLPSAHRGGEMVLRHAGRKVTLDLSSAEVSEVRFAAFYADCEHAVQPITTGNRVCLVYNLIQARGRGSSLSAPDYTEQTAATAALLSEELSVPGAPIKIAWLLEHHYSPDGLCFSGLKSVDAARVRVLIQAAERADCAVHLGIVNIEESGAAELNDDNHGRGRYRDDDEDMEDAGSDEFEVIEVYDRRHYISHWRDPREQPLEIGEIPLNVGELLPAGALDTEKPDQQRLLEASGNEGAAFERSYHRAALVIWRRKRYADVLLQAGVAAALPYLRERVAAAEALNAPPTARETAMTLAQQIAAAWRREPGTGVYHYREQRGQRDAMLDLLNRLADAALLAEFITTVIIRDYDGSENAALATGARLLGAPQAGALHAELIRRHLTCQPHHCIDLLHAVVFAGEIATDKTWLAALRQIAEAAVGLLDDIEETPPQIQRYGVQVDGTASVVDAARIAKLLNTLAALGKTGLSTAAVEKFAARPAVFDPVSVLVPALGLIHAQDAATARLWEHNAAFILARSWQPPPAPQDWRQAVTLSCTCPDCRELQTFTLDHSQQVYRFRVRQDRRQHLHQVIEKEHLDMTHVTERRGSPQTLVCTKDRRSYQRHCAQYRKDLAALAELAKIAHNTAAYDASLKKIAAALSLAKHWSPA